MWVSAPPHPAWFSSLFSLQNEVFCVFTCLYDYCLLQEEKALSILLLPREWKEAGTE